MINAVGRVLLPEELLDNQNPDDDMVTVSVIAYPDGLGDNGLQVIKDYFRQISRVYRRIQFSLWIVLGRYYNPPKRRKNYVFLLD